MNKTIKIIDLLNKLANGEEVPKKIKYCNHIWEFVNKSYYSNGTEMLEDYLANAIIESLNDEVEIIEEDEDINIQNIKELDKILEIDDLIAPYNENDYMMWTEIIKGHNKINDLIKAVNKLDKEINNE